MNSNLPKILAAIAAAVAVVLLVVVAVNLLTGPGSPDDDADQGPQDPRGGLATTTALDAYASALNQAWSPAPTIAEAVESVEGFVADDKAHPNTAAKVVIESRRVQKRGQDQGVAVRVCSVDDRGYAAERTLTFTAGPLKVDDQRVENC